MMGYREEDRAIEQGRPTTVSEEQEEPPHSWEVPWHAKVPSAVLIVPMVAVFLYSLFIGGIMEIALRWGLSGAALTEGRFAGIGTHMFLHGGVLHIAMNLTALWAIGGLLTARMGPPPHAWWRFFSIYFASGLAGAAVYLALHPFGTVPMVGASGAIYGLLGALLRIDRQGERIIPLRSREIGRATWQFVKDNAFLFLVLTGPALLAGRGGGVAWEAHLGGFAAGLLLGPRWLVPERSEQMNACSETGPERVTA